MKTRIVKQYCCEFCKKRGLSASPMAKHEASCTLNPNRVCRVCKMVQGVQKPIAELKAFLPQRSRDYYSSCIIGNGWESEKGIPIESEVKAEINAALPALREAVSYCPACILAALRQSNIPVPVATDFNFTKEMKGIWNEINNASEEADACGG